MEVLLLGTGGARGWPEPGCTCASCSTAVRSRTSRAPACALVDDVLLLDGHEGLTRAAARAGRDLGAVRQVLLTRPPDGRSGWLDGVGGSGPVQVLGAAAVLAALPALGERLQPVPVVAGGRRETAGGYDVGAVQQGAGSAWSVVGPDGRRLLYAPGAGLLIDPSGGGAYDLVLLGVGRSPEPAPSEGAAPTLARLRRDGFAQPETDVCVIGHDHGTELPDLLQHQLAGWGARSPMDGTALTLGPSVPARPPSSSGRTLVLGGARSGKSALAEQLLAAHPHVTYVATGGSRAGDDEWQQRIEAHRLRRPAQWQTVETTDLTTCLREADGAVLVDCLGTWLTALLDRHEVWTGGPLAAVEAEVEQMLSAWRASSAHLVAVSNEVGSGVVPATSSGRLFRDVLGRVNAQVAAASETVLLTVAGVPIPLRAAVGP